MKSNNADDLLSTYSNFKSWAILNEVEMNVIDLLEVVLGNNFL